MAAAFDGSRCLACNQVCDVCADVCPNRANISVAVDSDLFTQNRQIIHVDGMCNECGNCATFCPHGGKPYKDKITIFWTEHDFVDSTNVGFLPLGGNAFRVRDESGNIFDSAIEENKVSKELGAIIGTIYKEYPYLLANSR